MATFDFALLNQAFVKHDNDWNFGPVCSSFSRIYWMTEGTAYVTFNDKKRKLTAGHIYLIPALTTHYDHCNGVFKHYYIHFVDRTKHIIEYYQQYDMPFEMNITEEDKKCIARLMELCPDMKLNNPLPDTYDTSVGTLEAVKRFHARPIGLRMEIGGLIMQLLSRFFSNATHRKEISDDRIKHTLYDIEKNLKDSRSVDEMAAKVNLGKDRFIRLFKQQTGFTPSNFIIRQKIHHAQMLFIDGNHSVKEVAMLVGYNNLSYFGRLFKKITKVSPSEFVRQNK